MKMQFGKKQFIIISLFAIVSIVTYYFFQASYKGEVYKKNSFTADEVSIISKTIHIDCSNNKLDEMIFTHSKETMIVLYISDIKEADITNNYKELYKSEYETTYQLIDNSNIECTIDAEANTAIVKIAEYNATMYKIVKTK